MTPEMWCGVIGIGSTIAAGLAGFFATFFTSKHELKKMDKKRSWEVSDRKDMQFSEMCRLVTLTTTGNGTNSRDALSIIAAVRAYHDGELGHLLDQLQVTVRTAQWRNSEDLLSSIINEKRKLNSQTRR